MAQEVQKAARPKFRGHRTLKSKVVTHFPENLAREYERITNTYMTLLNKILAENLPTIRRAMDAERDGLTKDADDSLSLIISKTFMKIQREFEKKAESFGLERKLEKLGNLTRKLSIREWKRVVHKTLGIDVMEDYYMGEFYREALKEWSKNNADLIKTIPKDTLFQMQDIVRKGWEEGKSNTDVGREIQKTYGIERGHAQFIARDQMAKLNADLTKSQHKDAGVEEYIWSDSGDGRVRHRHKELNGKKFSWNESPIVDKRTGRRAHPGQDYNCRCVACQYSICRSLICRGNITQRKEYKE